MTECLVNKLGKPQVVKTSKLRKTMNKGEKRGFQRSQIR